MSWVGGCQLHRRLVARVCSDASGAGSWARTVNRRRALTPKTLMKRSGDPTGPVPARSGTATSTGVSPLPLRSGDRVDEPGALYDACAPGSAERVVPGRVVRATDRSRTGAGRSAGPGPPQQPVLVHRQSRIRPHGPAGRPPVDL